MNSQQLREVLNLPVDPDPSEQLANLSHHQDQRKLQLDRFGTLDHHRNNTLRVSLRCTSLRQRMDRCMLMQVHAALFPNVTLLAMSDRSIRSATLTVVVTYL